MKGTDISGSNDFKRLNPHLYPLAGLSNTKPEHDAVATAAAPSGGKTALQGGVDENRSGKPSVLVRITSFRRKTLDFDNLIGGSKSLRDAIAMTIFPNEPDPDADHLIQWEILQVKTSGRTGTVVMVEELK